MLDSVKDTHTKREKILFAQVLYKLERFSEAIAVFESIPDSEVDAELAANLLAAYSESGDYEKGYKLIEKKKALFEVLTFPL